MERRLAAVLNADVVGYSRLMSRDEAGTLRILKAYENGTIDPMVAKHRGSHSQAYGRRLSGRVQ